MMAAEADARTINCRDPVVLVRRRRARDFHHRDATRIPCGAPAASPRWRPSDTNREGMHTIDGDERFRTRKTCHAWSEPASSRASAVLQLAPVSCRTEYLRSSASS